VFVAAETALVTVDRAAVEAGAAAGQRRLVRVAGALRRLSTYLSGKQLGITVTSLAIGLVTEPSAAVLLRGPLERLGLGEAAAETTAIVVALLTATAVQMVLGELVPKNIALALPVRTSTLAVPVVIAFTPNEPASGVAAGLPGNKQTTQFDGPAPFGSGTTARLETGGAWTWLCRAGTCSCGGVVPQLMPPRRKQRGEGDSWPT
jgi:hypothetical protein